MYDKTDKLTKTLSKTLLVVVTDLLILKKKNVHKIKENMLSCLAPNKAINIYCTTIFLSEHLLVCEQKTTTGLTLVYYKRTYSLLNINMNLRRNSNE